MPGNPILLCAPTGELRSRLEKVLQSAGYQVTFAESPPEAVAILRDRPIDLVVAEGLAVSGAIPSLRNASPRGNTPILIVAPAGDVEARIAFIEAGADGVIASGFAARELESQVEALLIRAGRLRPGAEQGMALASLVTFFSPKGGVGTTTLAVNSALLLAGGGGGAEAPAARVLLIDLDLQFGQVATHLNLLPRFDIVGLANDEQALADPALAGSYLAEHSTGVKVLAAPSSPDGDFRVDAEQLERILALFRPAFDFIVVDCGSRLDPRLLWTLEQADVHVFVIFPEIAALRATSLLLTFLNETATLRARTHFVVNHIFPKELLKTRDVENLLRERPAAEVPYTEVDMMRAVNEGIPLVLSRPTSPAAVALRRLAETLIGIEPAGETRPSQAAPGRRRLFLGRR
jgi:pilus assembly protein CpaE